MRLAIISDIHDNLINLEKCLQYCKNENIPNLIFCGDTTTIQTAAYLAANFHGEIFMVRGNIELWEEEEIRPYKNINYLKEMGVIEIDGINIGLCHEPDKVNKLLEKNDPQPEFIFYGHTHKPWLEKRGLATIVNPGNMAGVWHQATFATFDTTIKKLELIILANLK